MQVSLGTNAFLKDSAPKYILKPMLYIMYL